MIQGIIFDMDGVLIDACDWHRVAFNRALKEVYNYEISLEQHYKEYNGLPTKIKLKKLLNYGIISEDKFELIENLKQEETIKIIKKKAKQDNSKIELMNYLKEKNILIGCYTNSIKKSATMMLERVGVLNYLDIFITNQDVKNPKPDPEGYILCHERLNINKKNMLIIEDSDKGIQAAQLSDIEYLKVNNATEVNISLFKDII